MAGFLPCPAIYGDFHCLCWMSRLPFLLYRKMSMFLYSRVKTLSGFPSWAFPSPRGSSVRGKCVGVAHLHAPHLRFSCRVSIMIVKEPMNMQVPSAGGLCHDTKHFEMSSIIKQKNIYYASIRTAWKGGFISRPSRQAGSDPTFCATSLLYIIGSKLINLLQVWQRDGRRVIQLWRLPGTDVCAGWTRRRRPSWLFSGWLSNSSIY